ncbi:MAG: amidohydrolase family protein, partial [Alphaproteobacteria bacterium]
LDALLTAARLLRSGVTCVVDVHGGGGEAEDYESRLAQALAAYEQAGIRVALAAGFTERSHLVAGEGEDQRFLARLPPAVRRLAERELPDATAMGEDEYFGVMESLWQRYRDHPRIDLWFGPPGAQWVSDTFMERIAEQAERYDTGIQTHLTESIHEKIDGERSYGKPTLLHLRDLGVLSPRFSVAHGVWLTEAEIDVLAETGAAVSHNPSSNLRLRAGIAPLNAFLARGATVALGMDGMGLNDDDDMFTEMRLALRLNRTPLLNAPAPRPADVLHMATGGGARLIRKADRLGKLAPGYAADLVLIDLDRITWPWIAPEADPRELLMMRAQVRDVDTVLIDGEVVLGGGNPTRFDAEEAGRELGRILTAHPYPARAAEMVERLLPHVESHYAAWGTPDLDPYIRYNSKR